MAGDVNTAADNNNIVMKFKDVFYHLKPLALLFNPGGTYYILACGSQRRHDTDRFRKIVDALAILQYCLSHTCRADAVIALVVKEFI